MSELIKQLESIKEWQQSFELIRELDPEIREDLFLSSLERNLGKTLLAFGSFVGEELVTTAFVYIFEIINGNKVLWIFDMVTKENFRSQKYGTRLIEFIEKYAQENNFNELRVHSRKHRSRAHHFYRDLLNFSEWAVIFKKNISKP